MNDAPDKNNQENENVKNWFEHLGEKHIKEIGVKDASYVLDFGCGSGTYTIPVAKVVANKGKVFAIDEDSQKLEQLEINAKKLGLEKSIQIIKTDGSFEIPLDERTVHFTLLYNVSCCIIGKDNYSKFQKLIKEIYRITKDGGKIVIGIKVGKTMLNRIEDAIPLIQDLFTLEKKEKGRYFDGKNRREGLFYFLSKMKN